MVERAEVEAEMKEVRQEIRTTGARFSKPPPSQERENGGLDGG